MVVTLLTWRYHVLFVRCTPSSHEAQNTQATSSTGCAYVRQVSTAVFNVARVWNPEMPAKHGYFEVMSF